MKIKFYYSNRHYGHYYLFVIYREGRKCIYILLNQTLKNIEIIFIFIMVL